MNKAIQPFLLPVILISSLIVASQVKGDAQGVQEVESRLLLKASENIEKFRKGDAVIVFKTESGEYIRNAGVQIKQVTHDFLFGCIIFDLVGEELPYRPDLYKQRFRELFNFAVFPFYWAGYEPTQGMTNWKRTWILSGHTRVSHPDLSWNGSEG